MYFQREYETGAFCRLWRFGRFVSLVLVLVFTASLLLWGQSVQEQLNSALKGRILLLRNFYSGDNLGYDQNGKLLGVVSQVPWTLGSVEINNIIVTPQAIELTGNRMGTWYRNGIPTLVKVGQLKIRVTKPTLDGDNEMTLRPIFKQIFVETGEDLRPMVPDYWRSFLEGTDLSSRSAAWTATLEKERPPVEKAHSPVSQLHEQPGKITAPRVLSAPDPHYTEEAAKYHLNGISRLGIVVDDKGKANTIAVFLDPLGMGLDDQAVLAVEQWRFKPAMKNGQPVRVEIQVEVTFRCCP